MDISTLHTLTEDLAAFLSEVTQSDLKRPTPAVAGDLGDLYLHLIDQNLTVATAIAGEAIPRGRWVDRMDRASLDAAVDHHGGCGLESGYRQTARLVEGAFESATDISRPRRVNGLRGEADVATLYEAQITNTVIHTWDIAQALGISYRPDPDITQQALRTVALRMMQTLPAVSLVDTGTSPDPVDEADIFECVLTLSRRIAVSSAR